MKIPYEWKSDLSELIKDYINEKQLTGYKFESQIRVLRLFDTYYKVSGYSGIKFTKSMINNFIYGIEYEKPSTHYVKERLLNDFAKYLIKVGYTVYLPPIDSRPTRSSQHIPYIFSKDEYRRLLISIDTYPGSPFTNRDLIDPILFRLLYATGLRISEALNLTCGDCDFENAVLTIKHAKNNKDRLVPIPNSMNEMCKDYYQEVHGFSSDTDYFFKSPHTPNKIDTSTIYRRFRDYLLVAKIPHSKNGPRVHDIRHTHCVHSFKRFVLAGEDITNMLPYMAAYLGHSDFRATQYYLRLTADLYPEILNKTEMEFGYIIPRLEVPNGNE